MKVGVFLIGMSGCKDWDKVIDVKRTQTNNIKIYQPLKCFSQSLFLTSFVKETPFSPWSEQIPHHPAFLKHSTMFGPQPLLHCHIMVIGITISLDISLLHTSVRFRKAGKAVYFCKSSRSGPVVILTDVSAWMISSLVLMYSNYQTSGAIFFFLSVSPHFSSF